MHYLITGGAGFIGSNLADRLLARAERVTILDNLSREGSGRNIDWLRRRHGGGSFAFLRESLDSRETLTRTVREVDCVFHLAGQVAVTRSIEDPMGDFEDNALGTLAVLEAVRLSGRKPILIYSSSNKVYGLLDGLELEEGERRYRCRSLPWGVPESCPVDFSSPYGCSKGAGDLYVHDYSRVYGLPTVVLRQSCVYGPRQFGTADQGWLAWFIKAALEGGNIEIFGTGKQVRDVLHIDDLLDAYDACVEQIHVAAGRIYNVGGGPQYTLSIWEEFGALLEEIAGVAPEVSYRPGRAGDQKYYVSDIRRISRELGWRPGTPPREGIALLVSWIRDNLVKPARRDLWTSSSP